MQQTCWQLLLHATLLYICARKTEQVERHTSESLSSIDIAPPDIASLQAWTNRMGFDFKNATPLCKRIEVRTEFTGVSTAEEAVKAAVGAFNRSQGYRDVEVQFPSMGDWGGAARKVTELNSPSTCRFGDIMGLVNDTLKKKLEALVEEKARVVLIFICYKAVELATAAIH